MYGCLCVWACVCGLRIWGACRVERRPQRRFSLGLSHIRQRASTRVCDTQVRRHTGTLDTLSQIHRFPGFHYGRLRCTTGVWETILGVWGGLLCMWYLLIPPAEPVNLFLCVGGWVIWVFMTTQKEHSMECLRLRRHRMRR